MWTILMMKGRHSIVAKRAEDRTRMIMSALFCDAAA